MIGNNEAGSTRQEHLWMVALYEREERTGELLDRLGALGIDTDEATIVRVELNDSAAVSSALSLASGSSVSHPAAASAAVRHSVTGAILGSLSVLVIGLLLYSGSLLHLIVIEGMFAHGLVFALVGGALGAVVGVVSGLLFDRRGRALSATDWSRLNRDGFLVAIKMPPGLAEQAEEIARHLGAKEILL